MVAPGLRVSVVVATYNGAAHVAEQLDSIAGQTRAPHEILIGDDGSTDGTIEVVEAFAARSPVPVRLTRNHERLGYADNFLQTAERVEGELIAFADQDDVWLPGKLAEAVPAFQDPRMVAWMHGFTSVDADLVRLPDRRFHTGFTERTQLKFPIQVPHGARMVFRTDVVRRFPALGRAKSVYGEWPAHHDEWAMFGSHALGRIGLYRPSLMLYRRHDAAVGADCSTAPSISELLLDRPAVMSHEATAALARADYLRERAADPANADIRDRLLDVATYYDRLAPRIERRTVVRAQRSKPSRMAALASHVARGDYRSLDRSGLGVWSLVQDSVSTLAANREPPNVIEPVNI